MREETYDISGMHCAEMCIRDSLYRNLFLPLWSGALWPAAAGGGDRLRPDACPPAGQFLLRHLCPLHCKAPSASASRGRLGVPVLSGGKQLHGASI